MPDAPQRAPRPVPWWAIAAPAFALYLALAWPYAWRMPFMGDDYVFLDAATRPLPELFSTDEAVFGWWRPWSRGLHYATLLRLAGPSPMVFRLVGAALWLAALLLYGHLLRRALPPHAATIALFGVASLALWGAPLLWIPGVQDLWMLALSMAALALLATRRDLPALVCYALALLSKETAAVLPLVMLAWLALIERASSRRVLQRLAPFAAITVMWAIVHPTLVARATGAYADPRAASVPGPAVAAPLQAALSLVNLWPLPRPSGFAPWDVATTLGAALVLALGAAWMMRTRRNPAPRTPDDTGRALTFALAWTAAGWLPLLVPSIGWHAYYGGLGALGAWAGFGVLLARVPALAVGSLFALGVLSGAAAHTVSWDWGDAWYQRRAASWQEGLRERLLQLHPTLPPHTRLWFIKMPNNIGLVAGASSAVRVWYGEPTLRADYYSRYRPRTAGEPAAPDRFLRYDPDQVLVEIATGEEDVSAAMRANPEWTHDHFNLARQLVRAGDWRLAATEYGKLARLPGMWPPALYSGVCWGLAGERAREDSLIGLAITRSGLPADSVRALANGLRRDFVWRAAGAH
jgi:hypothetical protein